MSYEEIPKAFILVKFTINFIEKYVTFLFWGHFGQP